MDSLTASRNLDPGHEQPDGFDLSRGIGLASIGRGVLEILAPRAIDAMFGVGNGGARSLLTRAIGLRDIGLGLSILSRPRRAAPMWLRVAGDAASLALLFGFGTRKRSRRGRLVAGLAASAIALGVDVYASKRVTRAEDRASRPVMASVTIRDTPARVYHRFRDLERLPTVMTHLVSVETAGARSRWVARTPVGGTVAWEAEILSDVPGELIVWHTVDSPFAHRGRITFARAPASDDTEVRVEVELGFGAMSPSATLARFLTRPQIQADLWRFKQLIETGEVMVQEPRIHPAHAS